MKTTEQARTQLRTLASLATDLGYQVTFSTRTETEGSAAGKTIVGITISAVTD